MKGGITVELAYKAVFAALQGAGGDNPESAAIALGFPTGWKATCWLERANGRKRIKFSSPIGFQIHSVAALCVEFPGGLPSGLQEEKAKELAASLALGAPEKLPSQRAKDFIDMELAYEVVTAAIESSGRNSEGAAQLLGFPAGWKARRCFEAARGVKRIRFNSPQSGTEYHSLKALSDSGELPNGLPRGLQEAGAKELISKGSLELQSEISVPKVPLANESAVKQPVAKEASIKEPVAKEQKPTGQGPASKEIALTQIATKELAAKQPEPTSKEPESEETVLKQEPVVAKQHEEPREQESAAKEVSPQATKIAPKELAVRAPLVSAPPAKRRKCVKSSSSSSSDSSSSSASAKASQKVASGSKQAADIVPEQAHKASPNAAGTTSSGTVASTAAPPESLWYKSFDAAHGLPYWYHRDTKESVWERPAGAPA